MTSRARSTKSGVHHRAYRSLLRIFVPHTGNEFHPHLIRPIGLMTVGVIIGILFMAGTAPRVESTATDGSISRQELLSESNRVRRAEGLPQLTLDTDLSSAAGLKARDMLIGQYWDHTSPDGTTPWYWLREVNYRYDFAGENLAKGFASASAVMAGWLASDEHRKNALSRDYQEVGFGVVDGVLNGEQTTVVVALYASPLGSATPTEPTVLAAKTGDISLVSRFGIGLQSLNPLTLGTIVILLITLVVALSAHALRARVPASIRSGWRRHHALYKSVATACLILLLLALYGRGHVL